MNVFLRKIAFCYGGRVERDEQVRLLAIALRSLHLALCQMQADHGKLPARPAKPVDTIAVLQTASYCTIRIPLF